MEISQIRLFRQVVLIAGLFLLCWPVAAQESSSQQEQQQQQQEQQGSTQTPDQTKDTEPPKPADAPTPGYPIDSQIHPAGKAIPWMGSTSPLRWGDFSVASITMDYVNDNFRPEGSNVTSSINLAVFRTTVGFDRFFGKQHLVLQIDPQVAILDGQLGGNAGLNNHFNLGFVFQITPKLTFTLKNGFDQVQSRQLFPMDVLGVDAQGGNLLANDFLQTAGSYWRDSVSGVINYTITPRLLLTVAPSYSYAQTTDNQVNYIANGHTIANSVAVTYALTPRQNIGVLQSTELLRASGVANAANTYFNTVGVFYGYQIAKTWWIQARLGVDLANYPNQYPSEQMLGGGGSLIKGFSNSTLAISYGRGKADENFISASISDRGDITYGIHITKRLGWYNGAGFYRETGAPPQNKGEYVNSKLVFLLNKGFSVFANYTYVDQNADTQQLLSGIRHTYSAGLGWMPPFAVPGH